jgi:hypothetical protein
VTRETPFELHQCNGLNNGKLLPILATLPRCPLPSLLISYAGPGLLTGAAADSRQPAPRALNRDSCLSRSGNLPFARRSLLARHSPAEARGEGGSTPNHQRGRVHSPVLSLSADLVERVRPSVPVLIPSWRPHQFREVCAICGPMLRSLRLLLFNSRFHPSFSHPCAPVSIRG